MIGRGRASAIRWRSLLLGGAISAACIALLLRSIDLAAAGRSFAAADWRWVAPALATIGGSLWMRCWKWQLLFLPDDRVSLWGACSASLIGYMFNTVLPGRVGELVRATLIGQTDGVGAGRALGTIFIEKLLDVLLLLVLLGALTLAMPLPQWVTAAGVSGSLVFGTLGVLFFALSGARRPLVGWIAGTLDPLPLVRRLQLSRLAGAVLSAATGLAQPRLLALQLALTVALWSFALLTIVCLLRAFHIEVPVTAALLLLITTNLGMTVPSAPGYIGVYEAIAVLTLQLFGVPPASGLSVALALHVLGFGSFTLAGAAILIWGLNSGRYRLGHLWQRGHEPEPLPEGGAAPTPAALGRKPGVKATAGEPG